VKTAFNLQDGKLTSTPDSGATILVFSHPSADELMEIRSTFGIGSHDLESALDPDEIARVESSDDLLSVIWKRPQSVSPGDRLRFEVSSVGLFFRGGRLLVVTGDEIESLGLGELQNLSSVHDVLLRFLRQTVQHFLGHLKVVRQLTASLESKISKSMENRYLLQMFGLGESLVYYLTAIESNSAVLSKLQTSAEKLGLSVTQRELLDDVILDNRQCSRQAQIYSSILGGLMDARGNIVNNNMNVLLKNLMLINIIFLPLNLIASIGGMSEYSMMTMGIDWRVAYLGFCVGLGLMGWGTWIFLVRAIDRKQSEGIRRRR
jgi:magnesium transporter